MKNESEKKYDVIIVGGGFSGTMVAVHLARAQSGLRIALVDRGPAIGVGRGLAYGTTDPKHLLNVPAGDMGAFPDDIGHFYRWLQSRAEHLVAAGIGIREVRPDSFVPRMVFGDYIQDLLREARALPGTLDVIHDEVLDIERMDNGHFELTPKAGRALKAAHVVLALGNFPPGGPEQNGFGLRDWLLNNPYSADVHAKLAEPGDVLIIGTGLTSLDVLLSLDKTKREGKIHLLSRRGLFPQAHKKSAPYPPFLDAYNLPGTARLLFRRVARELRRASAHGVDWRPVLDALRPFNQAIWTHLPPVERRRFLRHVQPIWDTHRHRCAPEVMAVKNRMEAEGRLVCHRGEIQDFRRTWKNVEVAFRHRGTNEIKKFCVRYVLSCTGPQADYRKLKDPLVRRLLARDLLAPDPMRMGAHTGQGGRVCDQAGEVIQGLYTLGSLQKGRLYESIAVPELRSQAAALAGLLRAQICKKLSPVQSLSTRQLNQASQAR
ncbi:MAG TPA: FAD-dependent oxidoreductase [Candidatus Sulfotelmatobacter sp.]|nr:FAD-dependent oxidoreductase [Candidatus Sulfotelmatobacter sp.]